MSVIADLEGLKFPDEMVTRFFFKCELHKHTGRVLELGCGNANNLSLFSAYGWQCMGLDISHELLSQGQRNFLRQGYNAPRLEHADLNNHLPDFGPIDVLLLPSSIYYVHPNRAIEIIQTLAPSMTPGAYIFCRFRTPNDYRYGKGHDLGMQCFRLSIDETSEYGCINAFYSLEAMQKILEPCRINSTTLRVMKLAFDNLGREERMIHNDEIILWGRTFLQNEI